MQPATPLQIPAAVRRVELAGAPVDLELRRDGEPYRSALLVATMYGRPLGTVIVALDGPLLAGDVARAAIECQLHVPRKTAPPPAGVLPGVSVIVATCGQDESVLRTVSSVLRCDPPAREVIVVENRPAGSSVAATLAERFGTGGPVRCVAEARRGLSWARNAGIAVASGDVFAFTDDDVEVEPGWVGAIAGAFADEPAAACVTGLILPAELETPAQLLVEQYASWGKGYEHRVYRHDEPTGPLFPYAAGEFGSGANTALRANFARATGGFDPALGVGTIACGSEDLDVYIRALLAGQAIVYEPAAMLWHRSPDNAPQVRSEVFRYGVSLAAVITKFATDGHAGRILGRVPAGLRFLRDPQSRKNAGKRREYPRVLDWIEYVGMAMGPMAYAVSCRRTARMVRGQRTGPPQAGPGADGPEVPARSAAAQEPLQAAQIPAHAGLAPGFPDGPGPPHPCAEPPPDRPDRDVMQSQAHRIAFDAGLLALLALTAVAITGDLPVLRPVTVLLALLLVPGGAVLTRLRVDDPASALGLAIGLSIALETLLAAAAAAAQIWEPWLLAAGLGAPAAVLLALDLQRAITKPIPSTP